MTKGSFTVCPSCGGSGYHDNLGDVTDLVSEDPDFAEDYMAGAYNVGCPRCHGRNVVPQCAEPTCSEPVEDELLWLEAIDGGIDWPADKCYEHLSPMYQAQLDDRWNYLAEVEAERRAGC